MQDVLFASFGVALHLSLVIPAQYEQMYRRASFLPLRQRVLSRS